MLKNAENGDSEPEEHQEPDKTAPVICGAKRLGSKEQNDGVCEQELKLKPRAVRRRGAMKNELSERDQAKGEQRGKQRGNDNFPVREIHLYSPGYEKESSTGFQNGARPVFDSAVGKNAKGDERTYSNAHGLHGRGFPAVSGIRATSSTQALP